MFNRALLNRSASLILLSVCIAGGAAHAVELPPAHSRDEFCSKNSDPNYFKSLALDPQNTMGFTNPAAGIGNGGLCWWHSQLQRSSLFLSVYRPDLPKPTDPEEIKHLFEAIMKEEAVVEVPGYSNFNDFTAAWQDTLIQLLADWQISQGVVGFGWIDGVGADSESASSLKSAMDDLYDRVENKKEIAYEVLKMPGLVAHAWLVVDMRKTDGGGYELSVLDSNTTSMNRYDYTPGMTNFEYFGSIPFVPYLHKTSDLKDYKNLMRNYCEGKVDPTFGMYHVKSSQALRQPQVGDACRNQDSTTIGKLINVGESGQLECKIPGSN